MCLCKCIVQGNYVRIAIATLLKSLNAQAAYLVFLSFGGTNTLFRPVKGARKSAQIRDKIAKTGQILAFYFYVLKGTGA